MMTNSNPHVRNGEASGEYASRVVAFPDAPLWGQDWRLETYLWAGQPIRRMIPAGITSAGEAEWRRMSANDVTSKSATERSD
jgi:hypothetical protein